LRAESKQQRRHKRREYKQPTGFGSPWVGRGVGEAEVADAQWNKQLS